MHREHFEMLYDDCKAGTRHVGVRMFSMPGTQAAVGKAGTRHVGVRMCAVKRRSARSH